MQVIVRDNNVDQALKVLKKKMQREGMYREMKKGRAFEKPSEKKARENFVKVYGITQPAPAPRFSRTPGRVHAPPAKPGEHKEEVLEEWGFDKEEISSLKEEAVVGRS